MESRGVFLARRPGAAKMRLSGERRGPAAAGPELLGFARPHGGNPWRIVVGAGTPMAAPGAFGTSTTPRWRPPPWAGRTGRARSAADPDFPRIGWRGRGASRSDSV